MMKLLLNSHTRLWAVTDSSYIYLGFCDLWRVMMPRNRLIVRARFTSIDELYLIGGADLHVLANSVGRPDVYDSDDAVMKFFGCEAKRAWLMHVIAMSASEVAPVNINAEFSFKDCWLKGLEWNDEETD